MLDPEKNYAHINGEVEKCPRQKMEREHNDVHMGAAWKIASNSAEKEHAERKGWTVDRNQNLSLSTALWA